ncbi:LysR family transcriptional regulator [Aureimonas fodinaquatilis]|uniref:LysR family transcriptional regulator n=1 Tax=Aureimonas fodinaquatilis TaxID=2565783 RepID=A0A5B0DX08_9HYPH|nr:LysR family transcriptional regulator [Aureimonas fodinaquatilis]KAA0971003.1 LysR family transcriptional regulator [Aureimonas fodinaquatilis]
MDWDDLRVFLTIARTGQILAAAKRLGLNHATVARRLDRLESKLHARLFTRRSTGCELTDTGAALLLRAERIEAEALAAESSSGDTAFSLSGTVRVGAPDGFGTAFLAPRLWRLSKDQPQLTIQLVPMARAFSLSRREADLAITIQQPDQGRLVCRKLVDYGLGLYAAADYLRENPAPLSVEDLARHRLIGHVEDLVYSPSLNYAEDAGINLSSTYEVSSAIGQLEAVAAGAGIGILHHFMARGRANLVPILPDINIGRTYWLVFHQSTANIANIRFVSDAISALVQAEKACFQ